MKMRGGQPASRLVGETGKHRGHYNLSAEGQVTGPGWDVLEAQRRGTWASSWHPGRFPRGSDLGAENTPTVQLEITKAK